MPENPTGIRHEARQARDVLKYLVKERGIPRRPRAAMALLEVNLPGIARESGVAENPRRGEVASAMLQYQIGLNDSVDFAGANRPDLQDKVEETKAVELERRQALEAAIDMLPEGERERARNIVASNVKELRFVERDIRIARDERHTVRFDEVDRYRSLINAMNLTSTMGVLLGPGYLENRLGDIAEPLSMERIEDKYNWIVRAEGLAETEKPIAAMYNMCQAAQIIDDRKGCDLDNELGVPTYATVALDREGTVVRAEQFLKSHQKVYEQRARELGLDRFTNLGFKGFIEGGTTVLNDLAPKYGRLLPEQSRYRQKLEKKLAPRERARLQKRI